MRSELNHCKTCAKDKNNYCLLETLIISHHGEVLTNILHDEIQYGFRTN